MDRIRRLYNFKGVAGRQEYWLTFVALYAVGLALVVVLGGLGALIPGAGLLVVPPILALMVAGLAVQVRRLHDRGKSGWWLIVFSVVPGVLGGLGDVAGASDEGARAFFALLAAPFWIWGLVEMGFLPGRKSPNRFIAASASETAAAFE